MNRGGHSPPRPPLPRAQTSTLLNGPHPRTPSANPRRVDKGVKKPGGPRSIWVPRRVREVGAQFPDRQGRVSPSQALSKPKFRSAGRSATRVAPQSLPFPCHTQDKPEPAARLVCKRNQGFGGAVQIPAKCDLEHSRPRLTVAPGSPRRRRVSARERPAR